MLVKLEELASGTIFKWNSVTYKKGTTSNPLVNEERVRSCECTPKYGGQWQDKLTKDIPTTENVEIKAG